MIGKRKRQKIDKTIHMIATTIACLLFLFNAYLQVTYEQRYYLKFHDELKQQDPMEVVITRLSYPGYKSVSYASFEYTYEGRRYSAEVLRAAGDYVGKKIEVKFLPSERRYVRGSFVLSYNASVYVYILCGVIIFAVIGSFYYKRRRNE